MGKTTARISASMRKRIMERDHETCQVCGAQHGDMMEDGRKAWLVVEHYIKLRDGGLTEMDNLQVACRLCHAGARTLKFERPSYISVKMSVNKATRTDQKRILGWLLSKYGHEVGRELEI